VAKVRGDRLAAALGAYTSWMDIEKVVNGRVVSSTGEGGSHRGSHPAPAPGGPAGGASPGGPSGGASPG
jgi:hypothetical protein